MKKHLRKPVIFLSLIAVASVQSDVFGWATGEGSAYAQGNMIVSGGFSFFHIGLIGAFDYGIHDFISAGAAAGYNYHSRLDAQYHHFPLMVRAAVHPFNLSVLSDKIVVRDMVDVYGGITTGMLFILIKRDNISIEPVDKNEKTGFRIGAYLGFRYKFKDKLAFFVEHCGDLSKIAMGINYLL